ncbi:hypothetical protein [Albimonas pacifica]|uniref:Uncharacterized protein n=1 Tax=Albimonas pacifica TaxID=1114924 RepID=A0A1I3LGM8_9RHOB|nr:hypothetical protein [Albimonas pacifica]SFI83922.1 hypothetical protein SAMN05216258_11020 [Albimonas pacifica]
MSTYRKRFLDGTEHDVYEVLIAFGVTCPACQHAIKKLLAAGQRGSKGKAQDLKEAEASVARARQIEEALRERAEREAAA